MEFLQECATIDIKKKLEEKLLELKIGYWDRITPGNEYPARIPGAHDQDLSYLGSVEYTILDKRVVLLPTRQVLLTMHRYPNQLLVVKIDRRVAYKYHFSKPEFVLVDSLEIYSLLYGIYCQRNLRVSPL